MSSLWLQSCRQKRRCQDSKMTSASQIKRQCQTKEIKILKCREKKTPGQTEGSRKDCQDSKTRKIQKCQGQRLPKDDKRKLDQEKVASSGKGVKIKKCQGEKMSRQTAANRKTCQDSEMSGAKRQRQHQTKMSRARNVKDKYFQEITEATPFQPGGPALFL